MSGGNLGVTFEATTEIAGHMLEIGTGVTRIKNQSGNFFELKKIET